MVLVTEQDSLPEEVEAGAAVHLAFKGFDAADVAFDSAAALLEGEAVDDGGLVAAVAGVQPDHPEPGGGHQAGPDRAAPEVRLWHKVRELVTLRGVSS